MGLLLDAVRAAVRAVATRLLDWAAPPPAPAPSGLFVVRIDPADVEYDDESYYEVPKLSRAELERHLAGGDAS